MLKFLEPKYRIIHKTTAHSGSGYTAEVKYWWLPFYINVSNNYYHSIEESKQLIKLHKGEFDE